LSGIGGLGRSHARRYDSGSAQRTTFADVAGVQDVEDEVMEIVDFLRNPDRYRRLGAQIPHSVLLAGAPGTGKTLLARAVAGQANVPFFSISASEFVEMIGLPDGASPHLLRQRTAARNSHLALSGSLTVSSSRTPR
jgi:cell division protease FtsH